MENNSEVARVTPPQKRNALRRKAKEERFIEPPKPENSNTYGVGEFLDILRKSYPKGKRGINCRGKFIKLVCNEDGNSKYHYVPVT